MKKIQLAMGRRGANKVSSMFLNYVINLFHVQNSISNAYSVSPANYYNHRSKTFKKNRRCGL